MVDAFGHTNFLTYDNSGHLTNSIDVAGIPSSFAYNTNDVVTNYTTPYGTTSFVVTDGSGSTDSYNGRSLLVTQPDGGHQLFLYTNNAAGVAATYPSGQIPNTTPFANTFDTQDLELRDTFRWNPRQYADLSTTDIASFTANDFRKAHMKHWLQEAPGTPGNTISIERDPSPDVAGAMEGQKTWYDYQNKSSLETIGSQRSPLIVGRVLPDGSSYFKYTTRNTFGSPLSEISTFSTAGGVGLRTNIFVYNSNGIDLVAATNALGVQASSNVYNAFHEVLTNYNALSEMTVYTYDTSNRLTSITSPNGLVTTNIYGSDDFLAQEIVVGFSTNSYTYADALILTSTDARGLTTTNTWDALNRLTSTKYSDGSYISNSYTFLDLTATRDRMDNRTYFAYDSMRRKITETNANGAVTHYNYCTCGSLDSIVDALSNTTTFGYDNQGNLTNVIYADSYSVTNTYDLLRRVVQVTDSGGSTITNWFNNQGLQTVTSNVFGRVRSAIFDALDRPTNNVDINGVSLNSTYDNLNRPLTRSYPDGGVENWRYAPNISGVTSYTNQIGNVTLYAYDPMNRKTNEVQVGVATNGFTYGPAGDLLTITDGKSQTTTWGYDMFGRATNKLDAASNLIFVYKYDADNRLTNRWNASQGYDQLFL